MCSVPAILCGGPRSHGHGWGRDQAKLWPIPANKMGVLGWLEVEGGDQLGVPIAFACRKGRVLQAGLGIKVEFFPPSSESNRAIGRGSAQYAHPPHVS